MKVSTNHPFAQPGNDPDVSKHYRILDYPSGNLLAVTIEDGEVLMDREQAIELLRILQLAVPELTKETT